MMDCSRFVLLALLCLSSGRVRALDVIDVDLHRKSGRLQLGVTPLATVAAAWHATPSTTGAVAELCVKGAKQGYVYAGFDGREATAKLRWLRLSAGNTNAPHCAVSTNLPNIADGLASGLRVGSTVQELLVGAGKLFRVVDDEWIFENVGERSVGKQKVTYQLLLQGRVRDNRVYELTTSYGETYPQ